jgi:hypothetical protein
MMTTASEANTIATALLPRLWPTRPL